jgi:hypothetical protein
MASSTLRFQIEVASDQATEALRAVTAAVNEAGVKMRGSFSAVGPAVRGAGTEIGGLTESIKRFVSEERGQARTARFFVSEIAQIIPISGGAKAAMTQFGGALLSGGPVGLAIGAGVAALGLLVEWYRKAGEEAEAAAEKSAKAAADMTAAMGAADASVRVFYERFRDFAKSPQEKFVEGAIAPLRAQLEAAQLKIDAKWAEYEALKAAGGDEERLQSIYAEISAIGRLVGALDSKLLEEKAVAAAAFPLLDAEKKKFDAIAEAARKAAAEAKKAVEIHEFRVKPKRGEGISASTGIDQGTEVVGRDDQFKLGKQLDFATERQELYNEQVEASIALAQEWGEAIGSALGDLATGQITIGEAMAQVAKTVLQSIIKSAIAQITANAAVTGTEAAKSQAGIPVVGPALAVAAMSAMSALVMAQLSNVPSAAGGWWDTGNYTGLAMVHPRELIADEPLANAIRSGGSRGWTVNIVGPMDGRSVERVFASNQGPIAKIRRRWDRRGRA